MAKSNRFLSNDTAQAGNGPVMAVMLLIVVGTLLYVGIAIMDGIETSTAQSYTDDGLGNVTGYDTFYNVSQDITTGVEGSFGMAGTLMLIIIAAAILAALIGIVAFIR